MFGRVLLVLFLIYTIKCQTQTPDDEIAAMIRNATEEIKEILEKSRNASGNVNQSQSTPTSQPISTSQPSPTTQTIGGTSSTTNSSTQTPSTDSVSTGFTPMNIRIGDQEWIPFNNSTHILNTAGSITFSLDKDIPKISVSYDKDIFNGVKELTRNDRNYFVLPYTVTESTVVNVTIGETILKLTYTKTK